MMKKHIIIWAITPLLLFLVACSGESLELQYKNMVGEPVVIPYEKLKKKLLSLYVDTVHRNCQYKLVSLIRLKECLPCNISELSMLDNEYTENRINDKCEVVYIVEADKKNRDFVFNELCRSRINHPVYIDTCTAFMKNNPTIPDNPIFHTFLLNWQDSVIMVGNPFRDKKRTEKSLRLIDGDIEIR